MITVALLCQMPNRTMQWSLGIWQRSGSTINNHLQPSLPRKERHHPHTDCCHDAKEDFKPQRMTAERQLHVHPPCARDDRERDTDHRVHRQDSDDLVRFVLEPGTVGVLERFDHFLGGFEKGPLAFDRVADVIVVERKILGNELTVLVLKRSDDRALRENNAAHGDDISVERDQIAEDISLLFAFEELVFQTTKIFGNRIHEREALLKEKPHELVEKVPRTVLQVFLTFSRRLVETTPELVQSRNFPFMKGDHKILSKEHVDLFLKNAS